MKNIRKSAKKRWRNKKAAEKALKNVVDAAKRPNGDKEEKGTKTKEQSRRSDVLARVPGVKEIRSTEIVRSQKFLGSRTFGSCYLGSYRGYVVAIKEYKTSAGSSKNMLQEVCHEAKMIGHLGDHPCLPLLFGVITKAVPFRLVTQFHGEKEKSLTLSTAVRRKTELAKRSWLHILKRIIDGLSHTHKRGVLHNDLKANNIVLEKRETEWNPIIIDFGKARFMSDPKPPMSLRENEQNEYRTKYPHIAPEIVSGGAQSVMSDIFSYGKIASTVLDLLATATSRSVKAAKRACDEEPAKRPSLKELRDSLV